MVLELLNKSKTANQFVIISLMCSLYIKFKRYIQIKETNIETNKYSSVT